MFKNILKQKIKLKNNATKSPMIFRLIFAGPICQSTMVEATVLVPSGHSYCFECIFEHLTITPIEIQLQMYTIHI